MNKSFGTVAALMTGASVFAINLPSAALAQEQGLPAVRNLNGKLTFGYLASNGNDAPEGGYVSGAMSVPLGARVGAQLDFSADNATGDNGRVDGSKGVGLHLFTRDPNRYLLGIYAHRVNVDTNLGTAHNDRLGVEAELYSGNFTFAMFAGKDKVSGAGQTKTFGSATVDLDYYISDNTMLTASAERAYDKTSGSIGVQHLYGMGSVPMAVSATIGGFEGEMTASLGATVFFGNDGLSLKDINRTNDPRIRTGASAPRNGYFQSLKSGTLDTPFVPNPKYKIPITFY
ncbi:hypothetical protein [Sagittula salina]|uniref:Porin n=1 Tax=Sagittula salina TaxID=2820268 RepID=A0A940MNI7_9RHOB|nr:hypothetical protein [Sagittula salina]MBP0485170.1 hypothetical protein [Sagittula salina]